MSNVGLAGVLRTALQRPGLLVTDAQIISPASSDYRGWYRGHAIAMLRPKTVEEVQQAVSCCADAGCAVVPQGGNTSLCGASVPSNDGRPWVILSTVGLDRIRSVDPLSWSIVAEAGCTIAAIQDAARSAGRHFGLDFGARDTARLGGTIATNAGGMNVVRYGNCRDLVLGLEVVLPDGRLWSALKALRKDNSGFDLKHLFIGSEGTLGVITAASLKIHPAEQFAQSALLSVKSIEAAGEFAELAMEMTNGELSAIELMPAMGIKGACENLLHCRPPLDLGTEWYVLIRMSGRMHPAERIEAVVSCALDKGLSEDAVLAQSPMQESNLWAIRDSFSDLHRHLGASIRFDYSVPLGRVPKLFERLCATLRRIEPDFVPFAFGHLGDGNLHFSACQPPSQEADRFVAKKTAIENAANEVVWELGGSISAEHGIGQLHREELHGQKDAVELDLIRGIKDALDPHAMFNPGKVFPLRDPMARPSDGHMQQPKSNQQG